MAPLLDFLGTWWDVILYVVFFIIQIVSWIEIRPKLSPPGKTPAENLQDLPNRQFGATLMTGASTAGITAVSILIPASVLILQLGLNSSSKPLPQEALNDVFRAVIWFTLSLLLGLYIIFVAAMRGQRFNVARDFRIGIFYGPQLFAIVMGVVRLVFGIFIIVYK